MNEKLKAEEWRAPLLALRIQVAGDSQQMRRDVLSGSGKEARGDLSSTPTHMADSASDSYDQDFTLERLSSSSETLQQIDEALERIEDGTYGCCEECQASIGPRRLRIKPYASLCIDCKRQEEEA